MSWTTVHKLDFLIEQLDAASKMPLGEVSSDPIVEEVPDSDEVQRTGSPRTGVGRTHSPRVVVINQVINHIYPGRP